MYLVHNMRPYMTYLPFFNFRFVYDYTVDYVSSRERANNS